MRKNIDGLQYLRGIAAMMVVGHHARHHFSDIELWTTIGARGVDIFFVISGFIMAYTTASTPTEWLNWKEAARFMTRRMVRVVPLYWVALMYASFSVWASWLLASDSLKELYWNWNPQLADVAKDLFFIPHESISKPGRWLPILVPGWTLNYEMFFYALFACCLLLCQYRTVMILALLIALAGFGLVAQSDSGMFFFYTRPILLEFGLGILLYVGYSNSKSVEPSLVAALTASGLGFIALMIGSGAEIVPLSAVGATLIVWSFLYIQWPRARLLKLLGDASYSIYIFHTAVAFDLARWLIDLFGADQATRDTLSIMGILSAYLLVSAIIGVVCHFALEKPMLNAFKRNTGRASLVMGAEISS